MNKVWAYFSNDNAISRSMKVHLTLDGETTLCKLRVKDYYEESQASNGTCKNCLTVSERKEKRCWSCKKIKPLEMFHKDSHRTDGYNGMCKECRRIVVRTQPHRKIWKKNHPETARKIYAKYRLNNKEKLKAWLILRKSVKEGTISKETCRICGKSAHAHHPDYSKPLEVVWLCQQHHKDIHYGRISL